MDTERKKPTTLRDLMDAALKRMDAKLKERARQKIYDEFGDI